MKTYVSWTTEEERILRAHYPTAMPRKKICELVPRHTWYAIRCHAARELKLTRPLERSPRPTPAWDRLAELLKTESLTIGQLVTRLQMKQPRVYDLLQQHRSDVHIAGWEPPEASGRWKPMWAYGNEPDAVAPFTRHTAAAKAQRKCNPFAAAAGLVKIPAGQTGRVFKQDMEIDEWFQSRAA